MYTRRELSLGGNRVKDELFGYLGIDTKYEKKLIYYRPIIKALRGNSGSPGRYEIPEDIKLLRVEDFTITKAIKAYRTLIERLEGILEEIKVRESPAIFEQTKNIFESKKYEDLMKFDIRNDVVETRNYIDFHYMCRLMLNSLNSRLFQIIDKYGSQLTDENSDEAIEIAENAAIEELRVLYYTKENLTLNMVEHVHDHEVLVSKTEKDIIPYEDPLADIELEIEDLISEKHRLHQTLADLSMIHQNRCAMINEMCDIIEAMIRRLFSLFDDGIEDAIHLLHENNGAGILQVASATNFMTIQSKQIQQKKKFFKYQEKIESFAFDKQFFYQQLEQTYNTPALELSGQLIYNENEAVNRINSTILTSIEKNKGAYNMTLKDMMNYYKQEAESVKEILDLAIDKEEIRLFYYIGNAVKNKPTINVEWMQTFFEKMNNY